VTESVFRVYWSYGDTAYSRDFAQMTEALAECETLRNHGREFVTMTQSNPNQVGKMGVDSIRNGVCPDGVAYSWVKRR
jgi:hypothetical protein